MTDISNIKKHSTSPYFDDHSEQKNFGQILFKPSVAIQVRELNQLQTILKSQVDLASQYYLEDGSRVIDGSLTLKVDNSFAYIKVETGADVYLSEFLDTTITGATSGVTARVKHVIIADATDATTLYVEYTNSGTNKQTQTFSLGEVITSDGTPSRGATIGGGTGSSITNAIGHGSAVSMDAGIYFIKGQYVYVPSSTLVLDKYGNTPSYIIGLRYTENIVTSSEDFSLFDNAAGTTNVSANGADRYQITTTLVKQNINLLSRTENNYIHLMTVRNGIQIKKIENKVDTELTNRLERRTFEESGNYYLNSPNLEIKEHLNANNNNGHYLSANGGSEDKFVVTVDPITAYIDGKRVEKLSAENIVVTKPRDTNDDQYTITETIQSIGFGTYVKISPTTIKEFDFYNTIDTALTLQDSSNNNLGWCFVRGIEYVSTAPAHFKVYVFNIVMGTDKVFSDVAKFANNYGDFLSGEEGKLFDDGDGSLVFTLPSNAVSTLKDNDSNHTVDLNVRIVIDYSASNTISEGSITFTLPSGYTLANDNDIIFHPNVSTANIFEVSSSNVTGVGSGTFTIAGINSTYNGQQAKVVITARALNLAPKIKTKHTNLTKTFSISGFLNLPPRQSGYDIEDVDIIRIVSIIDPSGNDVKDKFILDNGQRKNYYSSGKVFPKYNEVNYLATGTYTITYDCYRHPETGDYFSVDSYPSDDYADIPSFGGNNLRNCLDFRPSVARNRDESDDTAFSTGFTHPSRPNPIEPQGSIEFSYTAYLSRIDSLFLDKQGKYRYVEGKSDLYASPPNPIDGALHLYDITINPYVFNLADDVKSRKIDNRRFTMKDIGHIDNRLKNIEYYTSLSLLEKSAENTQIIDSSGDLKYKNGILADPFTGHNIGDTSHLDYSVSVDRESGILRPQFSESSINLIRKSSDTGTAVKSTKGGIVTMPYTEVVEIRQPYSSYDEFVNPYNIVVWEGTITLSPDSDVWKETSQRPDIIIDDTNSFEQFSNMLNQQNILGTVWNEWETHWTGVTDSKTFERVGIDTGGLFTTTVRATTTQGTATRTGLQSYLTSDTETREIDNKLISTSFIPFMRSIEVFFKAQLMKPNTKLYAFFNGVDITTYCKQKSFSEFSDRTSVDTTHENVLSHPDTGSGVLETDSEGVVEGSFIIPLNDSLKFRTGSKEFKLIDNSNNNDSLSTTSASEIFYAQGEIESKQKTIVSTKTPRIAFREVSDSKVVSNTSVIETAPVRYSDPLAQTFLVSTSGGIFVTSLELFFKAKDTTLPVSVSIREVENGTPTQRIVPGTEIILYPADIVISDNASSAQTINFDYPVHLKDSSEYAIVLTSNSDVYKVFVAEMGKSDLTNSSYTISKQPYNGVFFTSQNASTWTPEQNKDLKFTLKRASFTGTSSEITLINDTLPIVTLEENPIYFIRNINANSCELKIIHPNHGMYGSDNNHSVTLSGATGTINGVSSTQINGNHIVTDADLHSYNIVLGGSGNVVQITNTRRRGGGATIKASYNQLYDVVRPLVKTLEVGNTNIDFNYTGMTGYSQDHDSGQTVYSFQSETSIYPNSNNILSQPHMIYSSRNKAFKTITNDAATLRCVLQNSGQENLSPVIDLNRASLICVQNLINDATGNSAAYTARGQYVAETEPKATSNYSSYITKAVELATEADSLDVYLDINRPVHSFIDVYFRASINTGESFSNVDWILMSPESPVPYSNSPYNYPENHYNVELSTIFSTFQIKIVFRSERSTNVPTVKNLRIIATR